MQRYLNSTSIPLPMAVFLASDNYDYEPDTISATSLIKPIRQIILSKRLPPEMQLIDISSLVKSRMGGAIHDGIERAWKTNYERAMEHLGYPEQVIKRIRINPDPDTVTPTDIPVYLEQRSYRDIDGYKLSGKYDFIAEGMVEDFKSTSTFTWVNATKTDDYRLQGSIYRWLNPKIVTKDHMRIQFLFTDWNQGKAKADPAYPQSAVDKQMIPLLSLEETEQYIRNKLDLISTYKDAPEEALPKCTDKELWRSDPIFKYFKNPEKRTRSTKNFTDRNEAYTRLAQDGGVGIVEEVPGKVVACKYCPAFAICSQKDELIAEGSLTL